MVQIEGNKQVTVANPLILGGSHSTGPVQLSITAGTVPFIFSKNVSIQQNTTIALNTASELDLLGTLQGTHHITVHGKGTVGVKESSPLLTVVPPVKLKII